VKWYTITLVFRPALDNSLIRGIHKPCSWQVALRPIFVSVRKMNAKHSTDLA
jgi:hypothetical protein